MSPILALDPARRTNAQAIRDAHLLDYIGDEDMTLDVTYGGGKFWTLWRPDQLMENDLDPTKGRFHDDWRALSWADDHFTVVVFDPDYKLQGTSSNNGPASSNAAYGMDREYRPVGTQMALILNGLYECIRVCKPGGMILLKTMDQVVSGDKNWLTKDFWKVMDGDGHQLVDEIHVFGHRAQPKRTRKCPTCEGHGVIVTQHDYLGWYELIRDDCPECNGSRRIESKQHHTHGSFSTLMIFEKGKS